LKQNGVAAVIEMAGGLVAFRLVQRRLNDV
jgi:hypothetical protein